MNILVQPELAEFVIEDELEIEVLWHTSPQLNYPYAFIIGDVDFHRSHISDARRFLVLREKNSVDVEDYSWIQPSAIFGTEGVGDIGRKLHSFISEDYKNEQALVARDHAELKRQQLEKLNLTLSYQEREKSKALKLFHSEELNKKQREKKLLFFLDFVNSNYEKSNFLDEFFTYLSGEIKKVGSFHNFGFIQMPITKAVDAKADALLYQTDVLRGYVRRPITLDAATELTPQLLSQLLANLFQRPVSRVLLWSSIGENENFYFYLENRGATYDFNFVDSFIADRIDLLGIIVSKWSAEQTEKSTLREWRETFKAYREPIHVVDKDLNIVLSNYRNVNAGSPEKCYRVLAERDKPCEGCPLFQGSAGKSKNLVNIQGVQYQIQLTAFTSDQIYNILFYENQTELNSLKSQIVQSEKMNTIGNLANHLSHELNNPLTGLKLATELLLSDAAVLATQPGYHNLKNDLQEVHKAIVRSEAIIKDLVDFSGPIQDVMEHTDFAVVLNKTLTLLKSMFRGTRLFVDIKPLVILAHPIYLQQVIFNLLKNACEAMNFQGAVKVYQDLHPDHVDYLIEDNGPGVSVENLTQIFQPFFTTKAESEGTGLGLFLCSNLMFKMGAELIYDEKFKTGARFILRFKL